MKTLLEFLKEKYIIESDELNQMNLENPDLEKANHLFLNYNSSIKADKHLLKKPHFSINQIWSVKNEYYDFLGYHQKADHPFIVLINNELDDFEQEDFVRINVISPFTEFAGTDDIVCNDASIIGFPFLIETWNEQPVLVDLLDEYLGYFEFKSEISLFDRRFSKGFYKKEENLLKESEIVYSNNKDENGSGKLSQYQREFRDLEVSKAKYLNNSMMALLSFMENRQTQDSGVVISLFDKPEFPKFYIGLNQKEPDFALAAKSGVDTEDKYIKYKSSNLPFEIFIRKNDDGFIVTISNDPFIRLYNSLNQELIGISNKEKKIFTGMEKGFYNLISDKIKGAIKIILK